jgi:hypothetical protein
MITSAIVSLQDAASVNFLSQVYTYGAKVANMEGTSNMCSNGLKLKKPALWLGVDINVATSLSQGVNSRVESD